MHTKKGKYADKSYIELVYRIKEKSLDENQFARNQCWTFKEHLTMQLLTGCLMCLAAEQHGLGIKFVRW